jgi:hypothetical protein
LVCGFHRLPRQYAQGGLATVRVRRGWRIVLLQPIQERLRADGLYDHHQLEDAKSIDPYCENWFSNLNPDLRIHDSAVQVVVIR